MMVAVQMIVQTHVPVVVCGGADDCTTTGAGGGGGANDCTSTAGIMYLFEVPTVFKAERCILHKTCHK